MASLHRADAPHPAPPAGLALLALGFRPFYLLAGAFGALSIGAWGLQFAGVLGRPYLAGPVWHAHEMLFGFALAVIVGFLFTAGRNWTQLPTPTGARLGALVALWIAARVLVLTPHAAAAAAANVAFPLAAAAALAVPFVRARSRRNYFFVGLLVLMALAAALVHGAQLGLIALPARLGLQVALDGVLFVVTVMAGRVVPMFTNNGVPGASAARRTPVERTALGTVLALLVLDLAGIGGTPLAAVAALAFGAHAVRWALWRPWETLRVPLVWVLHLAYAWVPIHLLLRALGELGLVAPSAATHALTVGAIGGLVIGMMTRTARGHTGRPLRADRAETACFVLVALAAVVRVAVPQLAPTLSVASIVASAALWSAGFGLFTIRYWPVLSRPRIDGRPG